MASSDCAMRVGSHWGRGAALAVWLVASCGGGDDAQSTLPAPHQVDQQAVVLSLDEGVGTLAYDVGDTVSVLASVRGGVLVGTRASSDQCDADSACTSGTCGVNGRCACSAPTDCVSGVCVDGECQGQGVQLLSGVHFYDVPVASGEGEPVTSGAILAMAPRAEDVLVLATRGLYYTDGAQLVYSPLNDALAGLDITDIAVSGQGDDEAVWLVGAARLYRATGDVLTEVTLPDLGGAVLAVAEVGGVALVALEGGTIVEIAVGGDWAVGTLDADVGQVHEMAVANGEVVAATDAGLLWRTQEGIYTLFDLGSAVSAVASDGTSGFVALTEQALVLFTAGVATRSVPMPDESTSASSVTVDERGHVWVGDGATLHGVMVGEVVGFDETGCASDSPCGVMSQNCNGCHLDGANGPKHDFAKYAEALALADDIVHRVSLGNMPLGFSLSDTAYDTLLTWYMTGQNP